MTKLRVRTPAELIAAVPYMIGFHPADSLVVAAIKDRHLAFAARIDLPEPGDPGAGAPVLHLATIVADQQPDAIAIIGYGDSGRVTPSLRDLSDALTRAGVPIIDELRVADGRFWSYLCAKPSCCPREGKPCDPPDSVLAVEATFAGAVALASRSVLEDRLAAATGSERKAMDEADARAQSRLREMTAKIATDRADLAVRLDRAMVRAGRAAIRQAERAARAGKRLTDDEVAWLGYLMTSVQVRDYAWVRTAAEHWDISLWTDVVRRINPERVPAPASLLAFIAWQAGLGPLASIAVERALDADDTYGMAETMLTTLYAALPPSAVEGWPAPKATARSRASGSQSKTGPGNGNSTGFEHKPGGGSAARKARYRTRRRV